MNKLEQAKYIIKYNVCHPDVPCDDCCFEIVCVPGCYGDFEINLNINTNPVKDYLLELRKKKINNLIDE